MSDYKDFEIVTMSLKRYEDIQEERRQMEEDIRQFEKIMDCVNVHNEDGTKKGFFDTHSTGIIKVNVKEILNILNYDTENMKIEIVEGKNE